MRGWVVALAALAVVSSSAAQAFAESARPDAAGQRRIGATGTVGWYDGIALGVRVGGQRYGIEASGGFVPIIATYRTSDLTTTRPIFFPTAQLNVAAFVLFWRDGRTYIGATGGYKLNTVLGHGFGGGVYADYELSRSFTARVLGGPSIYPRGALNVRDTDDVPEGGAVFHYGTTFHFSLNVGLAFYP